jgi:hypothetical protein
LRQLDLHRRALLTGHALTNTALSLLTRLKLLHKGTLISLAHSHCIRIPPDAKRDFIQGQIAIHVGTGACTSREGYSSPITCPSIKSRFNTQPSPSSSEDPSMLLQSHIMREIAPILALRPLRRLLDMHDVSYSQKDKVKELGTKLRKYDPTSARQTR